MIDISQINYKSPTFQKIVGTVVLFFVILYLWHSQSYSVNRDIIQKKSEELEKIRRDIEKAKINAAKVEEIQAELERMFAQYKLIEELLPAERNVPDFINKIYLVAKQADAKVEKLEQKPSEAKGYYTADPYDISITTTYHGLGKFLSLVANLPFTALTKNLKISQINNPKYSIKANLTIIGHHMSSENRIETLGELGRKGKKGKRKVKPPKKKAKKVPS